MKRQRTEEAIALAMQSRWEEAVAANREIIDLFPDDVDAHNRLGKALGELGRYAEARQAYRRALEIDPTNAIAKKNLSRLAHAPEAEAVPPPPATAKAGPANPELFIEETGKTGLARLQQLASRALLARIAAGDVVELRVDGPRLVVETARKEYLGLVEPRVALRLIRLIQGGNRYAAAVASLHETEGRVLIKEVHQHPSQAGKPSFPSKVSDGFRPYIKESLVKYELGGEEEGEDGEYGPGSEQAPAMHEEEAPVFRSEPVSEDEEGEEEEDEEEGEELGELDEE